MKLVWREVQYSIPEPNTDEECPACGALMHLGMIRPPYEDGYLTPHIGYTCCGCGKTWQRVEDTEK